MKTDNAAPLEQFRRRLSGVHQIAWRPSDIQRIAARFGLVERDIESAYSPPRSRGVQTAARGVDDTSPDYTATISTPAIDRMNDSIDPNGWRLGEYRRNPVVQYAHASDAIPIGRSPSIWIEGAKLKATLKLAPGEANPLAEQVRKLIDGRFLAGCSVGFLPIRWEFTKDADRPYGINFLEQILLEWSICNIPANPQGLIDAHQQAGKSAAVRRRERDLDVLRMREA